MRDVGYISGRTQDHASALSPSVHVCPSRRQEPSVRCADTAQLRHRHPQPPTLLQSIAPLQSIVYQGRRRTCCQSTSTFTGVPDRAPPADPHDLTLIYCLRPSFVLMKYSTAPPGPRSHHHVPLAIYTISSRIYLVACRMFSASGPRCVWQIHISLLLYSRCICPLQVCSRTYHVE